MAEGVGFEPTVPCGTPDFESGTIDHSATPPCSPSFAEASEGTRERNVGYGIENGSRNFRPVKMPVIPTLPWEKKVDAGSPAFAQPTSTVAGSVKWKVDPVRSDFS